MTSGMDYEGFITELKAAAHLTGFKVQTYGSIGDDPLFVLTRQAEVESGGNFYLSAGIHGDEPAGCLALLELLRMDAFARTSSWAIFPNLNPWGLRRGVRENAAGCDLNRDYLNLSTTEVRAHVEWLRKATAKRSFDLYLSLHEDWETSGFYLYEIITAQKPLLAPQVLQAVEKILPLETGPIVDDHLLTAPGYIHHRSEPDLPTGWPEAIFHCRLHTVYSYTFETPSRLPMPIRIAAHCTAVTATLNAFANLPHDQKGEARHSVLQQSKINNQQS